MSVYANFASTKAGTQKFDEVRYQTIGRGHGFCELDGVPFQISDKYNIKPAFNSSLYKLDNIQIEYSRVFDGACSYSFDLERKVLANMANGHR